MNIKFVGSALDYSGYGEANRNDIMALNTTDVGITVSCPRYTLELADFGRAGEIVSSLINKPLDYQIVMLHTTPNVYPLYMEKDKYHIGRVFWETDKLPLEFAKNVDLLDEIWTGSESNAQAIRNAGVTKPIYIIPQAIDTANVSVEPYKIDHTDTFKFYSMFEWTERKNPNVLLEAFWKEFQKGEKVSLTIKTYLDNFTPEKKREIDQLVKMSKKKCQLETYPPVYMFRNLMDKHQIYRFHKTFDCFVSGHRGEGWGLPQMEAMLMAKPIISTGYGGIHEYIEDSINGFLLPYKMVKLDENSRNKQWYTQDQSWADVNVSDMRAKMRYAYENRGIAKDIGLNAQKLIKEKFSYKTVGNLFKKRLESIQL